MELRRKPPTTSIDVYPLLLQSFLILTKQGFMDVVAAAPDNEAIREGLEQAGSRLRRVNYFQDVVVDESVPIVAREAVIYQLARIGRSKELGRRILDLPADDESDKMKIALLDELIYSDGIGASKVLHTHAPRQYIKT
jgi:hypothetical protein